MLACRIHAKEDLRLEPVDHDSLGPHEVRLRLGAGGICGSDLHYYFEGRNGNFVIREPLIPGDVYKPPGQSGAKKYWRRRSSGVR